MTTTPPRFCQRSYACRYPACDCWPHTPQQIPIYGLFQLSKDGDGEDSERLLATASDVGTLAALEPRAVAGTRTVHRGTSPAFPTGSPDFPDWYDVYYWPTVPVTGYLYIVAALHDVDTFPKGDRES